MFFVRLPKERHKLLDRSGCVFLTAKNAFSIFGAPKSYGDFEHSVSELCALIHVAD